MSDSEQNASLLDQALTSSEALRNTVNELLKDLRRKGNDAAKFLAAGKLLEIENQFAPARDAYTTAVTLDPRALEARARLAVVQMNLGQFAEAVKTAIELVSIAPDFTFPSLIRQRPLSACSIAGDALRLFGDIEAASAMYRQAADLEQGGRYGVTQAILTLLGTGDTEGANAVSNKTMALPSAHMLLTSVQRLGGGTANRPLIREISKMVTVAAAEQVAFMNIHSFFER